MRNLCNMMRLDLLTMKPYRKILWLFVLVTIGLAVINKDAVQPLYFLTFFSVVMLSYPFALEEKNGLSMLYGSLSVNRKTIVKARYSMAVVGFGFCLLVSFVLFSLLSVFLKTPMDNTSFVMASGVCFLLFSLVISLQLPLFFKLGYSKARLMVYIPMLCVALIPVLAQYLLKGVSLEQTFAPVISLLSGSLLLQAVLFLAAGLLILGVSYCFSRRSYVRKELL